MGRKLVHLLIFAQNGGLWGALWSPCCIVAADCLQCHSRLTSQVSPVNQLSHNAADRMSGTGRLLLCYSTVIYSETLSDNVNYYVFWNKTRFELNY